MAGDSKVARYLERRADVARRVLVGGAFEGVEQVVVIPACGERDTLPETLDSLEANDAGELERTLVICVVNNRAGWGLELRANNEATLRALESRRVSTARSQGSLRHIGRLRLAYVDASSPGCELAVKEGVGAARKIGMDWGVAVLRRNDADPGLIVSLDADTLVEPNYLAALRAEFDRRDAWAAVIDYAHPVNGPPEECAPILAYETHLRYHALGLRYAGSPYAFHTIGSAMACTAAAYVAAGGMNRRQAGEDFYFLQALAKTGSVRRISGTTVRPSARASDRVPFGTGRRVRDFTGNPEAAYVTYDPRCYDVLRDWLRAVRDNIDTSGEELRAQAEAIEPALAAYLDGQKFMAAWEGLRRNAPDSERRLAQFHRWFDGFRTLKMVHHLRDHGFPQQPLFTAVADLLTRLQRTAPAPVNSIGREDFGAQRDLLFFLREVDRE